MELSAGRIRRAPTLPPYSMALSRELGPELVVPTFIYTGKVRRSLLTRSSVRCQDAGFWKGCALPPIARWALSPETDARAGTQQHAQHVQQPSLGLKVRPRHSMIEYDVKFHFFEGWGIKLPQIKWRMALRPRTTQRSLPCLLCCCR
jgi:hypothetical protein